MSKHFIIVCGFLDSKVKEKTLISLLKRLRKKPNLTICYSSHHENIPKKVFELTDYVVYNKENPILNWDIHDAFTRTFGSEAQFNDQNAYIQYYQPYHGFAHHLSVSDGITLGLNNRHETFSLMNYDVIDFCLEELDSHIKEINRGFYDGIFYPYNDINTTEVNTEFFTFTSKVARSIQMIRTYKEFSSHANMLYEQIISGLIKRENYNVQIRNFSSDNMSLGKIAFSDLVAGHDSIPMNDKFFVPFYEKWIDNFRYCYYYFPVKMNDKHCLTIVDETQGKMNCHARVNDNVLKDVNGEFYHLKLPIDLKIYEDDDLKVHIKLHDDRQFGRVYQKIMQKTPEGKEIGEKIVML